MFITLLKQEILMQVNSRRSFWAVGIFLILFVLIISVRIDDYRVRQQSYLDDVKTANANLYKAKNYSQLHPSVIKPVPLFSIFHHDESGGKSGNVELKYFSPLEFSTMNNIASSKFLKSDKSFDITFLISFILSLLILISAFDAINGEKELGQLRLVFSYPVKRISFLLKKIVGIAGFAFIIFMIPYLISLIIVCINFGSLADGQFFTAAVIYALLVLLFAITFSLIGVLISLLSYRPARSLVYALSVWLFLVVIANPLYDLLAAPLVKQEMRMQLYEKLARFNILRNGDWDKVPVDKNPRLLEAFYRNDLYLEDIMVFDNQKYYSVQSEYLKYFYKKFYKQMQEQEALQVQREEMLYIPLKLRGWFLFFSPVEAFNRCAGIIADNNIESYYKIIRQAISMRNDWMNKGVKEGWLFNYRYFQINGTETTMPSGEEFIAKNYPLYAIKDKAGDTTYCNREIQKITEKYFELADELIEKEKYSFKQPADLPVYKYSKPDIGDLVSAMSIPVMLLTGIIIIMLIICLNLFKKYDLR